MSVDDFIGDLLGKVKSCLDSDAHCTSNTPVRPDINETVPDNHPAA
jgi:hypothetical protein